MNKHIGKNGKLNTLVLILLISGIFSFLLTLVNAVPEGPTIQILSNSTKATISGSKINSTINTSTPGGHIFTTSFTSVQQNTRWKAYVGNVTGTLTLDDASSNTIFQWSLTSVSGEIYATRASGTVNWSGINCTWLYEGSRSYNESNRSAEKAENSVLSHTSKDDNITATFGNANHSQISIGTVVIGKNQCFSVQTWQRDRAQVFSDSDNANSTEVILYDGAFNTTNGNIVYETKIENNVVGFNSGESYDFQMLLPENGGAGFSASTAYYFYVELT